MYIAYKRQLTEAKFIFKDMWTLENTVKTQCKIMQTGKYKTFTKDLFLSYHSFHCYTTQNTKCTGNRFLSIKYHRYLVWQLGCPIMASNDHPFGAPPPPSLIRISNDHPWGGYIWIFSGTAQSYPKFILIGTQQSKQNGGLKT